MCGNGSNPTVELCWANSVLGTSLTGYNKTEGVPIYQTNEDPFVIAFQLPGDGPFVVKNSTWHAVYTNHDERGWGVININDVPGLKLNGGTTNISHVTSVGVPEPGTLVLLGTGIAMMGLRVRRKKH